MWLCGVWLHRQLCVALCDCLCHVWLYGAVYGYVWPLWLRVAVCSCARLRVALCGFVWLCVAGTRAHVVWVPSFYVKWMQGPSGLSLGME